jgi:sugar (pentulose or hexulose) kinase
VRQKLWVQVLADVLNLPLEVSREEESSGWGAALLGGLAAGVYRDYGEVKARAIGVRGRVEPAQEDIYPQTYRRFKEAYRRLEGLGGQA